MEDEAIRVAPGTTPIRKRRSSQSQTPARKMSQATGQPQTAQEYAQDLITGELAQRLFGVTQKIHKKLPPEVGQDEEEEESVFPVLPGSHLKLTHPSLEFVKALCKVLSLDSAITDEVSYTILLCQIWHYLQIGDQKFVKLDIELHTSINFSIFFFFFFFCCRFF